MESVIEALIQACANGDPERLATCLQYQLDLNFVTDNGLTPLMYAITYAGTEPQGDYYRVCEMLLEAGAHPDVQDALYGRTASHYAAYCKQSEILHLLMYIGCDIISLDEIEGQSAFHLAITSGLDQCVETMVQSTPALASYPTSTGTTPILLAAAAGNAKLCQLFLNLDCDPLIVDPTNLQSPLHAAAEGGHAAIVGMLLKKQAVLDAADSRGLTPVHLASCNITSATLSTICDIVGTDVLSLTDANGITPLMYACQSGSEECVEYIVKKKVNLLTKDDTEGKTCLHWAAESTVASADIINLLCKKKKQLVSETDAHGRTPLHSAAISGNVQALKALIDSGADPKVIDNNQYTAVHWAVVSGQPAALKELIDRGCHLDTAEKHGATPLHLAVQASSPPTDEDSGIDASRSTGAQQCIEVLLKAGANVTATDTEGRQPLHWAVQCPANLEAIQSLILGGADPNALTTDELNMTGLHVAAKHGRTDNCQYLIEVAGVDGNSTDKYGQTALFYSIESQVIDCSAYLLSIGCSANHKNNEGRSPVHIAATVGSIEGLELLSSYNGDVNVMSSQNVTPLHDAAVNGQTGSLSFILTAGGNPNPPADPEMTVPSPLHYSVSEGYIDCVQLLLDAGANVNAFIVSDQGKVLTPLDYAADYPELKELIQSKGGLPGSEIKLPEPAPQDDQLVEVETEPVVEEEMPDAKEVDHKQERPLSSQIRQQVSREHIDPFKTVDKPQRQRSVLSRLMSFRRQKSPPPDSIQSSVIGLYGAQATLLIAGMIGTAVGDKAAEIAGKVATDTADELKKAATEMDLAEPLEWLETPVKEPTPSPEPIEVPPTPQPSPPPKLEIHMTASERRMRKAKAQMDESKSLAFLAMEELLKAQSTQSQLKRQFVMAQLRENIAKKRSEVMKQEKEARTKSDQLLTQYSQRMDKATTQSEKVNSEITKQLKSAYQVNSEISQSMSALGINPRPTVSEWLNRKNEERRAQLKSTLHTWNSNKQQREVAISLKQAIASHRALKHVAWGTKKELAAQCIALQQGKVATQLTHSRRAAASNLHTAPDTTVSSSQPQTRKGPLTVHKAPKISTGGCIRATPAGFVKIRQVTPPPAKLKRRSSSLPDSTLWDMGQSYVGNRKRFYSGINHRAYGSKSVHAETTLRFVSPDEYRERKRSSTKPQAFDESIPAVAAAVAVPQSTRVEYHSHAESSTRPMPSSRAILPMKIIDQPMIV